MTAGKAARILSPPIVGSGHVSYRTIIAQVGAIVGAAGIAAFLTFRWLGAGKDDALAVALFMLCSGIVSIAAGWGILLGSWRRQIRLHVALIAIGSLGPLFMLMNVFFTARLMFLSPHDLGLLVLLLGFALTPGIAVATLLSGRIGTTVGDLNAGAARMASGDLTARVRADGIAELRSLAQSFNAMAVQLEASATSRGETERARRELIAAVSHDLRTPLASLRALAEALRDGVVDDPEGVQRYLNLLVGETERLDLLINDLFELSRLESGALRLDLAPSPIHDLVSEVLERMSALADQKGLQLVGEVSAEDKPILIDSQQVTRVLLNLVQNAIRHTPPDGSVVVGARQIAESVVLEVRDTGEGIPAEDLPRVFERFYRGDPARTREAGAGLGLAIARGIVEAHGGMIRVDSAPGQGTCFTVTLPAR